LNCRWGGGRTGRWKASTGHKHVSKHYDAETKTGDWELKTETHFSCFGGAPGHRLSSIGVIKKENLGPELTSVLLLGRNQGPLSKNLLINPSTVAPDLGFFWVCGFEVWFGESCSFWLMDGCVWDTGLCGVYVVWFFMEGVAGWFSRSVGKGLGVYREI